MIQFLVQETYPTYSVTFYREGNEIASVQSVSKEKLDYVVFGLNDEDKEQIFNQPITVQLLGA